MKINRIQRKLARLFNTGIGHNNYHRNPHDDQPHSNDTQLKKVKKILK